MMSKKLFAIVLFVLLITSFAHAENLDRWVGFANDNGVPDHTGVSWASYGADADRTYGRLHTATEAGTIDAVSVRMYKDEDNWQNAWVTCYVNGTLVGKSAAISSIGYDGWPAYQTIVVESGQSLDFSASDAVVCGPCWDNDLAGSTGFYRDTAVTGEDFTKLNTTALETPATSVTWSDSASEGLAIILRYTKDYTHTSQTYYVTQSGTVPTDGSFDNPWSVTDLNSNDNHSATEDSTEIDPGDIVYIMGEITSEIDLPTEANGIQGLHVTYRLDHGTYPATFNTVTEWTTKYVDSLDLSYRDYITITGDSQRPFDGQQTTGSGGINLNSGTVHNMANIRLTYATNIIINNVELRNAWNGIVGDYPENITITKSYIHDMAAHGIYFTNPKNVKIGGSSADGNHIWKCGYKTEWGDNQQGGDIRLINSVSNGIDPTNVIISHNHGHGVDGSATSGWGFAGIFMAGISYSVIEFNTLHDHGAYNFRADIFYKGEGSNHNHHQVVRFNNVYDEVGTANWDYSSTANTIYFSRNSYWAWVYGNRIADSDQGFRVVNTYAASADGLDGVHVHNFRLWANIVDTMTGAGITFTDGTYSATTDDMYDLFAINNSIHDTEGSSIYFKYLNRNVPGGGSAPYITTKGNTLSEGRQNQSPMYNCRFYEDTTAYSVYTWMDIDYNFHYDSLDAGNFKVRLGNLTGDTCYDTPCDWDSTSLPNDGGAPAVYWFENSDIGNPQFGGDLVLTSSSTGVIDQGPTITETIPDAEMVFYQLQPLEFDYNTVLHPSTDWSTIPPTIVTAAQADYGSGNEYGAYIYIGTADFIQDSGSQHLVTMEAEDYSANNAYSPHSWVLNTAQPGYSGTGAMLATPDTGAQITSGFAPLSSPRLDFHVDFTQTGTHYVWIRGWSTTSYNNSCHVGLDQTAVAAATHVGIFSRDGNYAWENMSYDTSAVATINVGTTGVHTVNVWMREDGFIIDKIILTTDSTYNPTGTGDQSVLVEGMNPVIVEGLSAFLIEGLE